MNQQKELDLSILKPNNDKPMFDYFDNTASYNKLSDISKKESNIKTACEFNTNLNHKSIHTSLSEKEIEDSRILIKNIENIAFNKDIVDLIDKVLTTEIDQEIKSYFKSNYAILWYSTTSVTYDCNFNNCSAKWHCDGGPSNHLKLICYIDGEEKHKSSTLTMNENITNKLKEIGYVYCNVVDRLSNIEPLAEHFGIPLSVDRHQFKAGESIIFNPTKILHKAEAPQEKNSIRTTFNLCFIPSPIPWKEAIEKGYTPANTCIPFEQQPERLLKITGHQDSTIKNKEDVVIEIKNGGRIINEESLEYHIHSIFKNKEYASKLFTHITNSPVNYNQLTARELIVFLKKSFKDSLNWDVGFTEIDIENFKDLISYEENYLDSATRYSPTGKPIPEAIMWPIPDHEKHPRCKFDMLPFVVKEKIMDKTTPIGSAGSCFAMEIAKVLQEEKFNYVITELGDNPHEEAIIDGYQVNSGIAMYSANFGILFNTPSLRQLAEKAFHERDFTKYLMEAEHGLYMDPYRENVYFKSKENFLRDYPKHIEAIKQTLLQSEVFIFTAGLNECWELEDGSVMSRNPRESFFHLIKHKVLTVEENINNIVSFYNTVKRYNPKFKLVLTLSPVPLLATGRGRTHHIIEANTHSKAVLRVAIEEVVKNHKDIYYLPSYELVTECVPNPWEDDHRHVTRDTVRKVIEMFKSKFVE